MYVNYFVKGFSPRLLCSTTQHCNVICVSTRSLSTFTLRTKLWMPTEKETPTEAAIKSHQLLLRGGFMRKVGHGSYAILPLGQRVLDKLMKLIDYEMQEVLFANKLSLPTMVDANLWKQSGRWPSPEHPNPELFTVTDRHDRMNVLAPTHEESITSLVAQYHYHNQEVLGQRKPSIRLYQIGTKFRDEIRPRFGLLRAREFIMKDMYSFDYTEDQALETYEEVNKSYWRLLLDILKLPVVQVKADSGDIGGNYSHEFHVLSNVGEESLLHCQGRECTFSIIEDQQNPSDENEIKHAGDVCPKCKSETLVSTRGIEVGHTFILGKKYSSCFAAEGGIVPMEMGCYGIGVTRLIAAAVESLHDSKGIVWPSLIAPYQIYIMSVGEDEDVRNTAIEISAKLSQIPGFDVLLDDRWSERPGVKLVEAELIGCSYRVVVGKFFKSEGRVEVQVRKTLHKALVRVDEIVSHFQNITLE